MRRVTKAAMLVLSFLSAQAMSQVAPGSPRTLEEFRRAFKAGTSIDIGPAHIGALIFANEAHLSRNRTVVVAVGERSGALALFKSDGILADVSETSRILSFQVIELEEDGPTGIITDEVLGSGTGIVLRRFNLYSFTNEQKIKLMWHARSFLREAPWSPDQPNPRVRTENGYVRFDPGGGGYPPRISYAFKDSSGHWSTETYRLSGTSIEQAK